MDQDNALGRMFTYDAIPNGIFVDDQGIVRYKHLGGFSVHDSDHLDIVKQLIRGEIDQIDEVADPSGTAEKQLARELSDTKFALGVEYLRQGRTEEALTHLERALEVNPDNFIIRKQIWAIRHPERFHPTIDWDWQKQQLAKERAAEEKRRSECGPGGCRL